MKEVMNLGEMFGAESDVFVLTNSKKYRGAYEWMRSPKAIGEFLKGLGARDAWIIPSSKHELLLIPNKEQIGKGHLEEMHRMVQESTVAEEDRLSANIWSYDGTGLHMTIEVA